MARRRVGRKITDAEIYVMLRGNTKLLRQARQIATDLVAEAKFNLTQDFSNHPVSREISAGSGNESGTLGGYGTLFSFIGFPAGSDPIGKLMELFESSFRVKKLSSTRSGKDRIIYEYPVSMPNEKKIHGASPMPWPGFEGRSWALDVETGISGLKHYLARGKRGRSGGGVQIKNTNKGGVVFQRTRYIRALLKEFIKSLPKQK